MQLDNLFKVSESKYLRPIFARHETFHPRYGWLKKGYDKVLEYPDLFLRENATVILGVGKNMVRSIRYWMLAFKLLEEKHQIKSKAASFIPTVFAKELLDFKGWDPYLSNQASLWLLHWNLLKSPNMATTWNFVFNEFHKQDFIIDDLRKALSGYLVTQFPTLRISENSLKKDINCLLRMYGKRSPKEKKDEDSIDSPFSELEIIKDSPNKGSYYFMVGAKPGLPSELIVSCCLEYASILNPGSRTISLHNLLYNPGGPGLVFRLTESNICEAIEDLAAKMKSIRLTESAGIIQLSYDEEPIRLSKLLLKDYYQAKK